MPVLVPVAHGSESLETVTIVNVLRRAGLAVIVASIEPGHAVSGTRGISLVADAALAELGGESFEAIVLPGGEAGARALGACKPLLARLRAQRAGGGWIGAICAAPAFALAPHGLLDGLRATGYPAFHAQVPGWVDEPVVSDGRTITSQGPATALAFALALVEALAGRDKRREVAAAMLARA